MMYPWQKNVRKVDPYVPGEQPKTLDVTKLNTNENPYPPAPGVAEALKTMDADLFRRYPDPDASILVDALAKTYHVKKEQVFVGVGSDDVIAMSFMTFFNSDQPVLFPDVTYAFYKVWAEMLQIPYETPALDENFRIRAEDYKKPNGGIIFPNPNAPTSIYEPLSFVEDIVKANPDSVMIVDEAYIDFGGTSALSLIDKYDNLLVVQTYSKSRSMAGMRIGFCIGNEALIAALNAVKNSYNSYTMSEAALTLGAAALADEAYFKETTGKIVRTREEAKKRLTELDFTFLPPMANFIFASHKTVAAKELFEALRAEGIFVRYFDKPRINNYLRITIGTPEQMEKLYTFLKKYVG